MSVRTGTEVSLDDRYRIEEGTVFLGGLQALVRVALDQARRDQRAGLRTGTFISGYPGSPLGTYDQAVQKAMPLLSGYGVVHIPAANEELAATAITGTQMLDHYPHARFDGVTAFWYGKGPGVDRSGDALKHGNFAGTSTHGAVVVLAAEDHEAKSSTMPFQDDYAFMSHGMPVVYPASVAEFLSLGLHAVALSRFSGCWVAMKLVGPLCDGGQTVEVHPELPYIVLPTVEIAGRPFRKRTDFTFFPGKNVEHERHLYQERHVAVRAYAAANHLDQVLVRSDHDRLGIITAGKSYADVRQALLDFGLDDDALRQAGVRLLKMGLIYPIEPSVVREFARGLEEVVVVEEKRGFLESQVREALYGLPDPPRLVGKHDDSGALLFPLHGGHDSDLVAERLAARLLPYLGGHAGVMGRLAEIRSVRSRRYEVLPQRTPNYCSGCPHNTSTVLLEGQLAWGSPGCHSFASIMEQPERHIEAMTQYGGEGLPWIGLSRFTDRPHLIQNVGDGSLFHSSYLNIRFAAATGTNITYKVLYNGAIANTGAQPPVGARDVPTLTRLLENEGVARVAILTKTPRAYRGQSLGRTTTVHGLDEYEAVMRDLEHTPGTTVLIYDESCANERRRQQKRGKQPTPNTFVFINEDVCENCGHCGALTNCMSLQKVDTELGPKTQVHTSSCNQDYSCLMGDCPSFLTVTTRPGTGYARRAPPPLADDTVPEPTNAVTADRPYHVYIPGVGGTGVLTINALLAFAAWIDRRAVLSYDQTGAAQKWGPVLSSLAVLPDPDAAASNKVGLAKADLYLAFDVVAGASPANLDRCDPLRTAALVVTDVLPTGEMVRDVRFRLPRERMEHEIARFTRADRTVYLDARRIAETLFGDYMMTNMVALGAAYQAGLLPLTASSIERAITLNGVQVQANVQAFRYGRLYVHDPARVEAMVRPPARGYEDERAAALARLSGEARQAYQGLLDRAAHLDEETRRLLAVRIADLIEYQDARYAELYVAFVLRVAEAERGAPGVEGSAITHAVVRGLHKLMAYKDEYEVARLHLKAGQRARALALFDEPRQVSYHLHPPLLRALGLKRKLKLGPWFDPALAALRSAKRLRGTRLDPFGYAHVRREERRLVGWYREQVERALANLRPENASTVREVAELPDLIRGYEEIKLRGVREAEARATQLQAALRTRPLPLHQPAET